MLPLPCRHKRGQAIAAAVVGPRVVAASSRRARNALQDPQTTAQSHKEVPVFHGLQVCGWLHERSGPRSPGLLELVLFQCREGVQQALFLLSLRRAGQSLLLLRAGCNQGPYPARSLYGLALQLLLGSVLGVDGLAPGRPQKQSP